MAKKILLISDTHGFLDHRINDYLFDVDEIWHAGDIGNLMITDELKKNKLCRIVYGNIDGNEIRSEFKSELFFVIENLKVFITHIGGTPRKYSNIVQEKIRKNKPDLLICGHSHILRIEYDKKNKLMFMNPGSIGKIGFHKKQTAIKFEVDKKEIKNLFVIEFGKNL